MNKMKYVIGLVLAEEAKKLNQAYRIYAADHDMGEIEFSAIRNGRLTPSPEKLSGLIDLELLKEPVKDAIKPLIDDLDAKTAIEVYNLIYRRNRADKE